jgi:hypothetical protein
MVAIAAKFSRLSLCNRIEKCGDYDVHISPQYLRPPVAIELPSQNES